MGKSASNGSGLAPIWWTGCGGDGAWAFLVELCFKVPRGLIAQGAVEPLPVIKDFDPFEDGRPRLRSRGEMSPRSASS